MLKRIVTHPGTGLPTVIAVCRELGAKCIIVTDLNGARKAKYDALILLGGSDISPSFYGQANRYAYPADRKRDAVEWYLTRRTLDDRKPILGICRGHQMLAVAAGGSLYQDIFKLTKAKHHGSPHKLVDIHPALWINLASELVNSLHRQAIKEVPFGFDVAAWSKDGIVEAIYRPGYLGVQFHPELMIMDNANWIMIFEWLIRDGLKDYSK